MKRIAVLGGGIAGLTCAFYLQKNGAEIAVFEANERPGGNIWTIKEDGWLVERGPATLRGKNPELIRLIADLGLEKEVIGTKTEAKARHIARGGRLRALPSGPGSLLTSRSLSFGGKLRLLKEPFVSAPDKFDENETVHDFVARRLGAEAADYLVNPFVAGIYAGDPRQLIAGRAFPDLVEYEKTYGSLIKGFAKSAKAKKSEEPPPVEIPKVFSFREGMQTLTDALGESLGASLRTSSPVSAIRLLESKWQVTANETDESFDAVVSTLPLPALSRINLPPDSDKITELIGQIPYPPVATMALGFDEHSFGKKAEGFGFLVPEREKMTVLGAQFSSAIFPGRAPEGKTLLTVFLGGMRNPESTARPYEEIKQTVLKELDMLLGITAEPIFESYFTWPNAIPQYGARHAELAGALAEFSASHPGFHFGGNYINGISVPDTVKSAKALALSLT